MKKFKIIYKNSLLTLNLFFYFSFTFYFLSLFFSILFSFKVFGNKHNLNLFIF